MEYYTLICCECNIDCNIDTISFYEYKYDRLLCNNCYKHYNIYINNILQSKNSIIKYDNFCEIDKYNSSIYILYNK